MAEQTQGSQKGQTPGTDETQLETSDLEALRIEAARPIKCGGTYTQCSKSYSSALLPQ